jgi:hypothetical protein
MTPAELLGLQVRMGMMGAAASMLEKTSEGLSESIENILRRDG